MPAVHGIRSHDACLLHHGVAPFLLSDSVACDCSALVVAATKAAVLLRSTAAPLDIRSDQMRSDHSLQILLHRCRYTSGHIRLFDIADSALRVRNPIPRHMLYGFDRYSLAGFANSMHTHVCMRHCLLPPIVAPLLGNPECSTEVYMTSCHCHTAEQCSAVSTPLRTSVLSEAESITPYSILFTVTYGTHQPLSIPQQHGMGQ